MRMMKQVPHYLQFWCWVMVSPGRRRAVGLQHPPFYLTCYPAALGTDASSPYGLEGLLGWRRNIGFLEGLCNSDKNILQTVQS